MNYGARHSDKCSDKELLQFRKDVLAWLKSVVAPGVKAGWKTLRAFNCFGGQVKVYTGKTIERMPLKKRRRLVAWKEPNGLWKGSSEALSTISGEFTGNQIWERHSEPIKEPECFSVFRSEWYSKDKEIADEEKEQLKKFLIK